jgi:quinol monooxygenase YgiN
MILVLASLRFPLARVEQALSLSLEHVARSRTETGCLAHDVYRHPEDDRRLVFVERWFDRAALDAHFRVPASRAFARELVGLALEPAEIHIYEADERTA